jgi:hypothetical protein
MRKRRTFNDRVDHLEVTFSVTVRSPPGAAAHDVAQQLSRISRHQEETVWMLPPVAIDVAKTVFELAIANAHGRVVTRRRVNRRWKASRTIMFVPVGPLARPIQDRTGRGTSVVDRRRPLRSSLT